MSSDQPNSDDHGSDEHGGDDHGGNDHGGDDQRRDDQGTDEPGMDDLTLGSHENKAHPPGDIAAPQQVAQAQNFMAVHAGVHGYGIGLGADGAPCMVLFADDLPADQVPETLDGLPVRVEGSGEFSAGG